MTTTCVMATVEYVYVVSEKNSEQKSHEKQTRDNHSISIARLDIFY